MVLLLEVEFHRILVEKDQKIAHLQHENSVLVDELQQLLSWSIEDEIRERATALKNDQLEQCLIAENRNREWLELRHTAALTRSQEELAAARSLWNEEKLTLQMSLRASHRLRTKRKRRSPESDLHWPRM
ncbi:unnamed protein product [Pleuronectes platessa]|uniref:Uncharacterized protein n=1 Tax=Pleuronectes platessa TaxID=8262 RepID=A0A9N7V882_PLEPL|nr:unnamed protein product [Pleuronectes platessa]